MSPYCNKVRRCLNYKQLPFAVANYNGLTALKAGKLSPVGKLPVLDYDHERIQDSARIAEFLEQLHPNPPLLVRDPALRAQLLLWEDWAGASLYFHEIYFRMLDPESRAKAVDLVCAGRPRWERAVIDFVFRRRYPRKLREQGLARLPPEEVERQFFALLAALEQVLEGRDWLVGERLTLADLGVVAQLDELLRTSRLAPRVLAHPRIKGWIERCNALAPA